jgi:hypothetical protein
MKKIKLLTIFFLVLSFNACTDLDEKPIGFYTDQNFFQNSEESEIALLYAYNAFNFQEYMSGWFDLGLLTTDFCIPKPGETQNGRDVLWSWNMDANTQSFRDFFKFSYIGINRANAVINNLDGFDANTTEEQTKINQIVGEAKFLRAWHNFVLVRLFGAIPQRTSIIEELNEVDVPLTSIEGVYSNIIADLEASENLMQMDKVYARANKVTAQGLLSKVYITLASSKATGVPRYEWVSDAYEMYTKAALWSGKVLNEQGIHAMAETHKALFDYDGPNNSPDYDLFASESEYMFYPSQDRSAPHYTQTLGNLFVAFNGYGPYQYQELDGSFTRGFTGWEVYRVNPDFYQTFPSGDLRASGLYTRKIYNENGVEINRGTNAWIICKKYIDPLANWGRDDTKTIFMRFSDIALIYAEAQGANTEGYTWINKIRDRAGLADLTPGLSNDAFRDAVVNERGFELHFEGHRLLDLRRTHQVIEKINKGNIPYAYFFPLPQVEVDLNPNINADPEKRTLN